MSYVQGSLSSQRILFGVPLHSPPEQISVSVHAIPSSQDAVLLVLTQPVAGLQESLVQTLPSLQFGAGPPTHEPPAQVSLVVQASASSQEVPSSKGSFSQVLVSGLQIPSLH